MRVTYRATVEITVETNDSSFDGNDFARQLGDFVADELVWEIPGDVIAIQTSFEKGD